jgi:gliding motility-associated-like protein
MNTLSNAGQLMANAIPTTYFSKNFMAFKLFKQHVFALGAVLMLLLLTVGSANAQTQFWSDTFEDAGAPSAGTRTPSCDVGWPSVPYAYYFLRTDGTNLNLQAPFNGEDTFTTYQGKQGSKFWAGEDTDRARTGVADAADKVQTIEWTGINITGKSGITFKGLFAAYRNEAWQNPAFGATYDFLIVEYKIDAGAWTRVGGFNADASQTTSGRLREDTDGNNYGDGTILSKTFQEFGWSIPGNGATLSLRFRVSADASAAQEFAIDNFRLFETAVSANYEFFEGSTQNAKNVTNTTTGLNFTLGNKLAVQNYAGYGVQAAGSPSATVGSNFYVGNDGNTGTGQVNSITSTNKALFKVKSLWVYPSSNAIGSPPTNNGSITFKGKKNGVQQFTFTKNSGFQTSVSLGTNYNGFTLVDFSSGTDNSNTLIDELEITLGGSFVYLAIDNFAFTATPGITNTAATSLTSSTATINSGVNPSASAVSAISFDYSTSSTLASGVTNVAATPSTLVSGNTSTAVSANLTSLAASTTYYYRAKATNSIGTNDNSPILNFTTSAPSGVLLSTNPTLTFANNTGLNTMATDGTGGSTSISDLDLQIFAGNKTTGTYTASTTMRWENSSYFGSLNGFNGITPGPDPGMTTSGFSALIIKSSSQASNFSLKSIKMQDWGAVGPVQMAGYNNGTLVGAITLNLPSNGDGVTKNQAGELTPAFFNDVDEVRIYSSTVNIWVAVNNIQIGSPVTSAVPTITSATYDASVGVLTVTAANIVAGDTMDASKLSITGQGGSYTLTSANVTASSATTFIITLNSADKLNVNGILNKNGLSAVDATVFNLAAAANWDATTSSTADLTGNGITVSNVAAPTITSATYNASTSTLTITGTGLVKAIGATNDVTVSKFTITGGAGGTRTLSTTGNVEVISATSISLTLAGADIAAVNNLLNKNGSSSVSGTTYNLAAADDWNTAITNGDISDLTGNGITVSNAQPTIGSATYDSATGILNVTAANIVAGDYMDASKLSITGQGGSYTLTSANVSASSSTSFNITVNSADKLNLNGILNKNGTVAVDATTFNLAAAANWNAETTSTADLTSNAITVSNVTAPTITSATYDGSTGVLTITGTGLVKAIGATNDITVSKFTITGGAGGTRTLSTTGNVEVISASSISLTLAGADIAAVNNLLNKNGTSSVSGTTYNLAAADDWNTVITDGDISDLTGNGITVNNAKPTIESATYNASTGVLAVTAANIVGGDTMDASKLSITGQGGSYTLTSANVTASSSTAFSFTLNAADKLNINGILNKNGTVAVDATTFNLAAAANWNATTTSTADLTSNAITVSNVTAPTITSATYNASTSTLTITGTGLVKAIGATNDVTVSKFTITGGAGGTRTLSTTGNVEVISATSISLTLAGADIAAVNNLLNKNGTSSVSGTTYNLAAADDWNTVITDGDISDLTGNGITVSNVTASGPTISSGFLTNIACFGGSTGTVSVNVTGGTAPYTYSWSPSGGTAATASGLAAGTYTVTVTDANSLQTTQSFTITQPASAVSGTTVVTNVSCNGGTNGSINLTPTGGTAPYTFNWGGTVTTKDRTGLAAGTYSVTITDANGCMHTVSGITITQPTAISMAIGSQTNISCFGGSNGTASVSPTGGTPGYTYSWSPSGGTAATASGLAVGTYTVTVTDANGCQAIRSFTISQPANALSASTNSVSVSTFGGNNGSATVSVSGGTPTYTYSWSPSGGTAATATGLSAGTYTVTVTDANGCQLTRTINVAEPTVVTSVTSTSTNATYKLGNSIPIQITFSLPVSVIGTPTLTLNTGEVVNYTSGSGTTTLSFNYTVGSAQTADLEYGSTTSLSLNGGTIKNASTVDAILTLPVPGEAGSLGTNKNLVIDGILPTVTSINRIQASPTNLNSVDYTVTFSEAVTGVDVSDFNLSSTGSITTNLASVVGSGNSYTVTINGVVGTGTIKLNLNNSGTGINDLAGNSITGGYTNGQVFDIDQTPLITTVGTLSALNTVYGTPSSNTTFSLTGANIAGGINVTAPTGFEVSLSSGSGFANQITVGTSGAIASTPIYVRLKASAGVIASPYSGNLTLTSTGAVTKTVATVSSVVSTKPLTLVLNALPLVTKTYDALTGATLLPANYSLTGIQGSDAVTVSGTANYDTKTIGNAKTITANAFVLAGADKDNYNLTTTSATTTGNITSKSLTLALNASPLVTKTYDALIGATLVPANYSLTGIQGSDAVTVTGTANYDTKLIGTAKTITANAFVLAGNDAGNYNLTTTSATTTGNITSKSLTLALNASPLVTKTYDALTDATLVPANYSLTGIQGSDAVTVTGTANYDTKTIGNAKTITANVFVLAGADKDNYNLTTTSATTTGDITVKELVPTIFSTSTLSKVFDGTTALNLLPGNFKIAGVQGTDDVSFSATANFNSKDVGQDKAINVTNLLLSGTDAINYKLNTSFILTSGMIIPKGITVTAQAKNKTYGNADPVLSYSFTPNLITGDSFSGSLARITGENIGNYPINIGTLAINSNYNITFTTADLTINKREITVLADLKSKIYGNADPTLTYTITGSLAFNDVFNGNLNRAIGENIGQYQINQGNLLINNNYTIAYIPNNLNITPKAIVITADLKNKTYGQVDPQLTYTIVNGLVNNDVLTGTLIRAVGENAGNYTINQGTLIASPNYSVSFTPSILKIDPKGLTIKADDKLKNQGTTNPTLTASYTGFVNGDNNSVLTVQPVITTTALTNSNPGTYPITVSGATAQNYNISYQSGLLTVVTGAITDIAIINTALYENSSIGTSFAQLSSTADNPSSTFTYSLVAGVGSTDNALFRISGSTIQVAAALNFEAKSNYSIRVRSTDQNGSTFENTFTIALIDVNEAPTLDPITNKVICATTTDQTINLSGITAGPEANQTTSLIVTSSNPAMFTSLTVAKGTGTLGTLSYKLAPGATGTAVISVTVKDNGGISSGGIESLTQTFNLTVNALPVINIISDKGMNLLKGETAILTASGGISYNWANANGIVSGQNTATLTVKPNQTTTYTVTVANANGCTEVKTITINITEAQGEEVVKAKISNIMSPNGDGINDNWIIEKIEAYPNNVVTIFDRAGREVYNKTNYDNKWDATLRGAPLAEGTYYYIIDFFGDRKTVRKGFITIVRNK